jgi:hypothetical protein
MVPLDCEAYNLDNQYVFHTAAAAQTKKTLKVRPCAESSTSKSPLGGLEMEKLRKSELQAAVAAVVKRERQKKIRPHEQIFQHNRTLIGSKLPERLQAVLAEAGFLPKKKNYRQLSESA